MFQRSVAVCLAAALLAGCAATHGQPFAAIAPEGSESSNLAQMQAEAEASQPPVQVEQQSDPGALQPASLTQQPVPKVPKCPSLPRAELQLKATRPSSLAELQAVLEAYLAEQCGTYGLYVIDLSTGAETGVLSDHIFMAASTYKLPMVMYILNEVAAGRASLDEKLTYTKEEWVDGAGLLKQTVKEGDKATIRQMVELAIQESDNIAAEMLLRRFRSAAMWEYLRSLGGSQFYYDAETYGTTPHEMAGYLAALYRGEGIADPALTAYLLNLLTHTAWDDRIDAGVPAGVPVAHKVGTWDGVINDAALVLLPERPYVLVFYSDGINWDNALVISAEVSRFVYEFFTAPAGTQEKVG